MKDQNSIELEGSVQDALPDARFVVKLSNGHQIHANLSGKLRMNRINIMPGDQVLVELSIYDLTKGRITRRKDNYKRNHES
jgi:translation initiation factor IF-1